MKIKNAISVICLCILLGVVNCTKDIKPPTITTSDVKDIDITSATIGGVVVSDGGGTISERGIFWGILNNPEKSGTKLIIGSGSGQFSYPLTGLTPNTVYYVTAYALNSQGIAYGVSVSFTTNGALATVTTTDVTGFTSSSATVGGNVTADGNSAVTENGVYWSTSQNPETSGTKLAINSGTGVFSGNLSGLSPNTTYYIKAYAINSKGQSVGQQVSFTTQNTSNSAIIFNPNLTYGTVSDNDGNTYKTILIGTQTWMAENLKTTKYSDGTNIPNITDITQWQGLSTGAYSWYDNNVSNKNTYGAMYNYYSVIDSRNICPSGWHVPTDNEWKAFEIYLGMTQVQADATDWRGTDQGTKLKSTAGWGDNTSGSNSSGFTAVGGGSRDNFTSTPFHFIAYWGNWWTYTEASTTTAWEHSVSAYGETRVYRSNWAKAYGLSVRCLMNVNNNSLLVFDNYDNIFSSNIDGTNVTTLTSGTAIDCKPRIDNSKTKIAFISNRTGTWQVYTMNINGTGILQLTTTGVSGGQNNGGPGGVDWTPDGKIVYIKANKIYKMNNDGTGVTELATAPSNYWSDLRCSPTGDKIAAQTQGSWGYTLKIYLMNIDGTSISLLADDLPGVQFVGNFSIDGQRFMYTYDLSGHEESSGQSLNDQIVSVKLDGTGVVNLSGGKLTGSNDFSPVYTPDASKIIFINNIIATGTMKIWIMNADGTSRTEFITNSPCYNLDCK